ncbi:hypothetical protein UY3_16519 [Chelonia mydas]|uniref:Uncharacterized protein n=1 Tax=Chelonia mydas TaxID=8469 RepID=M7ATX6_CHEMY|nr:hypothetical protein UY3_16519 [Chelonia mydas]
MVSALTPNPVHCSESALGTAASVRSDLPASLTSWHRSPSTGHKETKKMPSLQQHRGKPGIETRPMSGSPRPPPAARPPTHVQRSSPATSDQASLDVRCPPVCCNLPAPLTSRYRSPSTGHKKAKKMPSLQRHQGKPGAEIRPMSGGPRSIPSSL